jgi:poly-beta-hydroxyalkanoate depolymerase
MDVDGRGRSTRASIHQVNELATGQSLDWFERNLICGRSARYAGAGRRVYPGFLQLSAFMSMNLSRHVKAHHRVV